MPLTLHLVGKVSENLEGNINAFSIRTVFGASLLLVVLLVVASKVIAKKKYRALKKPLFIAIAATIILPTLLLMGSTVYINTVSESKGPVHWHADIEFWVCGQEIELRDPYQFLSNKIGTATYHEHDDKRIHLEGVVGEKSRDASLGKFMEVIGGEITNKTLKIPTEESIFENDLDGDKPTGDQQRYIREFLDQDDDKRYSLFFSNYNSCFAGGPHAEVQTFLYRFNKDNNTYTQTKLENPAQYTLRDESTVPPGDCLIVEFDTPKPYTDRLCRQYGIRDAKRCTQFGVSSFNPDLCNISETEHPVQPMDPNEEQEEEENEHGLMHGGAH